MRGVLHRVKCSNDVPEASTARYYAGHGSQGEAEEELGGSTGGAFVVGVGGGERGEITFDDLVSVWTEAKVPSSEV